MDAEVARRGARLHVQGPRPDRDALIAATALLHGLTLVTRNEADFAGTSVDALQVELDAWLHHYNRERPHLGYRNQGRRPWDTVQQFVSKEG